MAERKPADLSESVSLVILTAIATAFALFLGREFFVPIAFAMLLNAILRPVVRMLNVRGQLPTPIGAAIVTLVTFCIFGAIVWALATPAHRWMTNAPQMLDAARSKIDRVRRPLKQITDAAKKIQSSADGTAPTTTTTTPSTAPASAPSATPTSPPPPALPEAPPPLPDWVGRLFGTTTRLLTGIIEVLLMLYLLLASGDLFVRKLIKIMPRARDKEKAAEIVDEAQSMILRYLLTAATIFAGQGAVVGVAMWLWGMPGAWMWGLLTFALEFVPYLGSVTMVGLLTIAAFSTFDPLWHVLAIPLTYLVIATIQANVISPYAYGQRLRLNPVAVLIGVLFWWFLWGVAGAFLAVPIIATIKLIADRTEGAKAVGEFLGE